MYCMGLDCLAEKDKASVCVCLCCYESCSCGRVEANLMGATLWHRNQRYPTWVSSLQRKERALTNDSAAQRMLFLGDDPQATNTLIEIFVSLDIEGILP